MRVFFKVNWSNSNSDDDDDDPNDAEQQCEDCDDEDYTDCILDTNEEQEGLALMSNVRLSSKKLVQRSPIEYMRRFKDQARECIGHAYEVDSTIQRSTSTGALSTSLPEDVVFLVDTQFQVLREYLQMEQLWTTRQGNEFYVDALIWIFRSLLETHMRQRPLFLMAEADCCAAANDFLRLAENMETLLNNTLETVANHPFVSVQEDGENCEALIRYQASIYISQLHQDAVLAAERTHIFMMRNISQSTLSSDLFSLAWEDEWVHNQVIQSLVRTVDQFIVHVKCLLGNEFLYQKVIIITCKAVVCLYVRCLIEKADSVSRRRRNRDRIGMMGERQPFRSPKRALIRMLDDILILKNYFEEKSKDQAPIARIVSNELFLLEIIYECLTADDNDSLEKFIVVIHKRTGADALVTSHFVSDLWLLVDRRQEQRLLQKTMLQLRPDLQMVSSGIEEQKNQLRDRSEPRQISFVQVDEMLKALYEDRIVQGALPLCWACLPKIQEPDYGNAVVAGTIRTITRSIKEMMNVH